MTEVDNFEALDFAKSKHYTLSIHLCMDAFYFSVQSPLNASDTDQNSPIRKLWLRRETDETLSLTANVKQIFQREHFLNHSFKRVNFVIETARYSLIPFELFEDEQGAEMRKYTLTPQDNECELHCILPRSNVAIAFGMDKFTHAWLLDLYPDARFYCQLAPLAEFFCTQNREKDAPELYAEVHANTMNLMSFNRGILSLANTFTYQNEEDLCYYLLSVWQSLDLQPTRHHLHLAGSPTLLKEALPKLRRFLRFVTLTESSENESFTLKCLNQCE